MRPVLRCLKTSERTRIYFQAETARKSVFPLRSCLAIDSTRYRNGMYTKRMALSRIKFIHDGRVGVYKTVGAQSTKTFSRPLLFPSLRNTYLFLAVTVLRPKSPELCFYLLSFSLTRENNENKSFPGVRVLEFFRFETC